LKDLILVSFILVVTLRRLGIGGLRPEGGGGSGSRDVESSAGEVGSSAGDGALVLTGSLADHLTGRVLLLAVDRAYEGIGGGVGVGSDVVLELFIYYVQSFERSNSYTFSPLNDIEVRLVRLVLIEKKQSRSWSPSENY